MMAEVPLSWGYARPVCLFLLFSLAQRQLHAFHHPFLGKSTRRVSSVWATPAVATAKAAAPSQKVMNATVGVNKGRRQDRQWRQRSGGARSRGDRNVKQQAEAIVQLVGAKEMSIRGQKQPRWRRRAPATENREVTPTGPQAGGTVKNQPQQGSWSVAAGGNRTRRRWTNGTAATGGGQPGAVKKQAQQGSTSVAPAGNRTRRRWTNGTAATGGGNRGAAVTGNNRRGGERVRGGKAVNGTVSSAAATGAGAGAGVAVGGGGGGKKGKGVGGTQTSKGPLSSAPSTSSPPRPAKPSQPRPSSPPVSSSPSAPAPPLTTPRASASPPTRTAAQGGKSKGGGGRLKGSTPVADKPGVADRKRPPVTKSKPTAKGVSSSPHPPPPPAAASPGGTSKKNTSSSAAAASLKTKSPPSPSRNASSSSSSSSPRSRRSPSTSSSSSSPSPPPPPPATPAAVAAASAAGAAVALQTFSPLFEDTPTPPSPSSPPTTPPPSSTSEPPTPESESSVAAAELLALLQSSSTATAPPPAAPKTRPPRTQRPSPTPPPTPTTHTDTPTHTSVPVSTPFQQPPPARGIAQRRNVRELATLPEGKDVSKEEIRSSINQALRRQDWTGVKAILSSDNGLRVNKDLFDLALSVASKLGKTRQARAMMDIMGRRGLTPDLKTYNAMLMGIVKEGGQAIDKTARSFLDDLRSKGLQPNVVTYNTLLKAYSDKNDLASAKALLKEMRDVHKLQPDKISYTTAICACGKDWQSALELLREADRDPNVQVDSFAITAAMKCCASGGNALKVVELFDRLQKSTQGGLAVDSLAYNTVLESFKLTKDWIRGMQLLQDMRLRGPPPNTINFNTVMDLCAEAGRTAEALELFDLMKARDSPLAQPDIRSYTVALKACARTADVVTGRRIFSDMKQHLKVEPDNVMYGTLAELYAAGNLRNEVDNVVKMLRGSSGVLPKDIRVYTQLIRAYGKVGAPEAALQLLKDMRARGMRPTIVTYGTVMEALTRYGDIEAGFRLLDDMTANGMAPNGVVYDNLEEACRKEGRLDKVLQLKWKRLTSGV